MLRKAPPGQRPYIVTGASDAAAALTAVRIAMGWTGEELDARAGFSDRYTAKLEQPCAPWGKRGLHVSPMWEIWAETLGFCLVLMPVEQAEAIGAVQAPQRQDIAYLARYQKAQVAA